MFFPFCNLPHFSQWCAVVWWCRAWVVWQRSLRQVGSGAGACALLAHFRTSQMCKLGSQVRGEAKLVLQLVARRFGTEVAD